MDSITITKFKANCLKIINEVNRNSKEIIITKHNKPVAKVVSINKKDSGSGPLLGTILFEYDIISPLENEWEANK